MKFETYISIHKDVFEAVSSAAAPLPATNLPKPTPGFWSSQKKDSDSNDFGSTKTDNSNKEQDKNFLSTLTFPTFGAKKDDDGEKKSTLTFPSFGAAKENDKDGEKKPTLTFPSFGSTTSTTDTSTSGGLKFSFGALPKSSTEGAEEKGDEEGEYVPPKAEVVETEEAGATFSSKCSVFKLVDKQYSKMGVGMLHLKEIDGKKSVLVRAATAIGTVWVNALMNKTMKVAKADEKGEKIRLTCPASEKEISTYVIRFPSVKEATKVREEIEEASK
ncbi:hypothetical protein ANCDUO_13293 [Ancylostoma duodenale]|uniref:RanBD1 domain-containing protein n=1 Tax=Ancylostoma duodenale TaxID=51022 RepID=A0A0C2GHI1_9BILA|nr:hypothetical protein ANCDUO_13293 [Ancylostoma duodenale]